jgi:hypothetical protein
MYQRFGSKGGIYQALYSHETCRKGEYPFSRDGPIEAATMLEHALHEARSSLSVRIFRIVRPIPVHNLYIFAFLWVAAFSGGKCVAVRYDQSAMLSSPECGLEHSHHCQSYHCSHLHDPMAHSQDHCQPPAVSPLLPVLCWKPRYSSSRQRYTMRSSISGQRYV